jgi:hypothetical protein
VLDYPFYGPFRLINTKSNKEQIPLKNGPFLICQLDKHSRTRGLAIFFLSTNLYICELYNQGPPNFGPDEIIHIHVLREINIGEVKQCILQDGIQKFNHWTYYPEEFSLKLVNEVTEED